MPFVQIPKDLNNVKEKFAFGFTKRQVICAGIGVAAGLPLFFVVKSTADMMSGVTALMVCTMIGFFFGFAEKNGEHLEQYLAHMIKANFLLPKIRPYQSEDLYEAIQDQITIDKEVKRIGYKRKPSIKEKLIKQLEKPAKERKVQD